MKKLLMLTLSIVLLAFCLFSCGNEATEVPSKPASSHSNGAAPVSYEEPTLPAYQGQTLGVACCEQPQHISCQLIDGDGSKATLTYCKNQGCSYISVSNIEYSSVLIKKQSFGEVAFTSLHKPDSQSGNITVNVILTNPSQSYHVRRSGGNVEYSASGYTEYYLYEIFVINGDGSLFGIFELDVTLEYNNLASTVTLLP